MAVNTSSGARFYIGPATKLSDESDLAGLSYVEVKGVETLGDIGPQNQDVSFVPLAGDEVQHLKGARDNGATVVTAANLPTDPGQIAMKAAALTKFEYAGKIVIPDAEDANDTDTTIYVRGPVMSGRTTIGGANDVTKKVWQIGNNVFVEVPSEAVSGP